MVLFELHATPTVGHSDFTKTYDRVERSFSGMVWNKTFVILWSNVRCVNITGEKQSNLLAHYNRFQFHLLFGGISLWILLQAYPNREINQSSWWLLIAFPSMLISAPFNTRLQHPQWLNFSWIRSSSFTACRILLFLIATQLSPTIFRKNYSSYKAPNCISTQLIIPIWMVKLKFSTSVWKHIWGVLRRKIKISGINSYP